MQKFAIPVHERKNKIVKFKYILDMNLDQEFDLIKKKQDKILALLEELRNGAVENKDRLYDLTDLEKIFNVSRRTLFKWKSEGKMRFSQIGKKLYITDEELKRFLVDNNLNNSDYGRK